MSPASLDQAVLPSVAFLRDAGVPAPDVLLLLGTGSGPLLEDLHVQGTLLLGELPATVPAWQETQLAWHSSGAGTVWVIDDAPGDLQYHGQPERQERAWQRAFPVWLAAQAGARVLVHTSSGVRVAPGLACPSIALVQDHINLSGGTPLMGLGSSSLGPLFPDQTTLHHPGLRQKAQAWLRENQASHCETVAACLAGPALTTPAELAWLATTPAGIAVQNCAGPWIAAAHAGLSMLAVCSVCDAGERPVRMRNLLEAMESQAPLLDDLLRALLPDLLREAQEAASDL
ncbi:MAG: hypothetical protein R3F33_09355 [Planctomycetota bacterium]